MVPVNREMENNSELSKYTNEIDCKLYWINLPTQIDCIRPNGNMRFAGPGI